MTATSAHARLHDRLAALDDREAIAALVAEAAPALGAPAGASGWRRIREYFAPGREPYATLALEARDPQVVARVEAFVVRPPAPAAGLVVPGGDAGWLRMTPMAADPALPTLAEVLIGGPHHVMRYQPGRRCTLRFGTPGSARYAKVFADERAAAVHRLGLAVRDVREMLEFAVAEPLGADERLRTQWQGELAGERIEPHLLGPDGLAWARRLGDAAASLTRVPLAPPVTLCARDHLGRAAARAHKLARLVPGLERDLDALHGRLRELHAAGAVRPLRPVHGSPHPEQWLARDEGVGLVDLDGMALADPELDASSMIIWLERDRDARVPVADLQAAFLDAYQAGTGELDPGLLAAHRAQRWLAAALKAAQKPRADGDRRAARHLDRALAAASEAGR
jgi:hypothetical protein